MAKRLITLRRIRAEKIDRSRSWLFAEMAGGRFPKPLNLGGHGPNLWDEDDVDLWLSEFIAKAKERADAEPAGAKRVAKAAAGQARRREEQRNPGA